MKIFCISVYDSRELAFSAKDLSSIGYFQRSNVAQFMDFFGKTIVERLPKDITQMCVTEEIYRCYIYQREGYCCLLISDQEYPERVATKVCRDVATQATLQNIDQGGLQETLTRSQDPTLVNQLHHIQSELEDVRELLHKSMESILERGEKLENLVQRSEELSASSKMFYRSARKTNSCCVLS